MFLNHDVLRLIIAEVDDPATLYSLILASKWFRKELQAKFSTYFEPEHIVGTGKLSKPRIYHPLCQSHIDEYEKNGGHMVISKSGGYKIMQNLVFHQYKGVGIELKSENEKLFNVYIEGNNRVLKWMSLEDSNDFIFIKCENQSNCIFYVCNVKLRWYGKVIGISVANILGGMVENIYLEKIPERLKKSKQTDHHEYIDFNHDVNLNLNPVDNVGATGLTGPIGVSSHFLWKQDNKKNKMTWLDKKYQFKQLQKNHSKY